MATFTDPERQSLAKRGLAMKDGSYPIRDVADLHNAILAVGRASDPVATKKWIIKRARALGSRSAIPISWM